MTALARWPHGRMAAWPASDVAESWTVRHFSQAKPRCARQDDVPALLLLVVDMREMKSTW